MFLHHWRGALSYSLRPYPVCLFSIVKNYLGTFVSLLSFSLDDIFNKEEDRGCHIYSPIPNTQSRKSRNTCSHRQIWPWNTEWSRAKANRVLPRECNDHSKHPLPTIQEKTLHMDFTRRSTLKSDWLYSLQPKMQKLYTVSKNKTGSWLWLRS